MLSLADIEDARLKLAALEVRSPLMGTSALAQLLQVGWGLGWWCDMWKEGQCLEINSRSGLLLACVGLSLALHQRLCTLLSQLAQPSTSFRSQP
jgi:hypothetical protein